MWMSGLIIHAHPALATGANNRLDGLDRPIEEVDLLPGDLEPAATDDPRSPAADLGHVRGGRLVHQAPHDFKQTRDVEPDSLIEVEPDVIVRSRMRRARRPRAAKGDGGDAGNSGQNWQNAFEEGSGVSMRQE